MLRIWPCQIFTYLSAVKQNKQRTSATITETTPVTAIQTVQAKEAANPILIQNNGGVLSIQGAADGTPISVYTVNGTQAGSSVSNGGQAQVNNNLQPGTVAIVKIGEKSVKMVVKMVVK